MKRKANLMAKMKRAFDGNKLKTARESRGITQETLAHALHSAGCPTSNRTICNWEKGKDNGGTVPNVNEAIFLAVVLGVKIDDLFSKARVEVGK